MTTHPLRSMRAFAALAAVLALSGPALAVRPEEVRDVAPVPPEVARGVDAGRLDGDVRVSRAILVLPVRDPDGLARLLDSQQDPTSPGFRRWLSPEEFGRRSALRTRTSRPFARTSRRTASRWRTRRQAEPPFSSPAARRTWSARSRPSCTTSSWTALCASRTSFPRAFRSPWLAARRAFCRSTPSRGASLSRAGTRPTRTPPAATRSLRRTSRRSTESTRSPRRASTGRDGRSASSRRRT